MKWILMMCTGLLFSAQTFAHVSGEWNGWVYWTYEGQGTKCFSDLSLSETAAQLHRKGGFFDCGIITMEVSEMILSKSKSNLEFEGQNIGTWKEDFFQWTERYSDEVTIHNTILVKGNAMDYHEQWIEDDGTLLYDIKGRFFRP